MLGCLGGGDHRMLALASRQSGRIRVGIEEFSRVSGRVRRGGRGTSIATPAEQGTRRFAAEVLPEIQRW